tara:strand:+ start:19 stop:1068 length:1050 start_codon:yes stop_codon:yes gene_type:complete
MEQAKIICTIGPSCDSVETLLALQSAGVDIFRVNMSHASIDSLKKYIEISRTNNIRLGIDTEGAQIRTKLVSKKKLFLKEGENIRVKKHHSNNFYFYPKSTNKILKKEMLLRLGFNGAIISVNNIDENYIDLICINSGWIENNKGVDVINQKISLPDLTDKDIEAIKIAKENNIFDIFLSFCKSKTTILETKKIFPNCIVSSKIESKLSINNLDEILEYSESILIDRGDLTREINILDIPFAQRGIINMAKKYSKPCYVATNVLESLIKEELPNRAELNDIVSTLEMGATGIVLAAETAIGKKPILCAEIVKEMMHRFNLHKNGLLFTDLERNEITDKEMKIWLNRINK